MWTCKKCGEVLEDTFSCCWKCRTDRSGTEQFSSPQAETEAPRPLACPRCDVALAYVGTKAFHEGTRWGVLGELGELFVNKERLDVYSCPRCGRVEFFVDGVGEEFRPH